MRKVLSLFLAFVMSLCVSLCACGEKEPEFDPKEEFRSEVSGDVATKCFFSYKDIKSAITFLSDIKVDGDTCTGKGKVTIRDAYGDTYVGKVTAVYRYNEETKSFSKISLDIETPNKQ